MRAIRTTNDNAIVILSLVANSIANAAAQLTPVQDAATQTDQTTDLSIPEANIPEKEQGNSSVWVTAEAHNPNYIPLMDDELKALIKVFNFFVNIKTNSTEGVDVEQCKEDVRQYIISIQKSVTDGGNNDNELSLDGIATKIKQFCVDCQVAEKKPKTDEEIYEGLNDQGKIAAGLAKHFTNFPLGDLANTIILEFVAQNLQKMTLEELFTSLSHFNLFAHSTPLSGSVGGVSPNGEIMNLQELATLTVEKLEDLRSRYDVMRYIQQAQEIFPPSTLPDSAESALDEEKSILKLKGQEELSDMEEPTESSSENKPTLKELIPVSKDAEKNSEKEDARTAETKPSSKTNLPTPNEENTLVQKIPASLEIETNSTEIASAPNGEEKKSQ